MESDPGLAPVSGISLSSMSVWLVLIVVYGLGYVIAWGSEIPGTDPADLIPEFAGLHKTAVDLQEF